MKSLRKKLVVLSFMAATASSLIPTPSQAIIGAIVANPALIAIGDVIFGGAIVLNLLGDRSPIVRSAALYGLLVLDDQGNVSPKFTAVDTSMASQLGVGADAIADYNSPSQLDLVNKIYQTIETKVAAKSTEGLSNQQLTEFANQEWTTDQQALKPNTQLVLTQIRAGFAHAAATTANP